MGMEFCSRGRRLDEVIHCMHQLHRGETVSHSGEFYNYKNVIMQPAPTERIPVWVGGASTPALQRAARNDGWLGVPLPNKSLKDTVDKLFDFRRDLGKYDQQFDVVLSPMESIDRNFVDSLDPAGTYHSSVLPWTPSPWGRAFWVEEGEDHTELEVKFRAMERFHDMLTDLGMWD